MVVYLDLFILKNFIFNILLIFICGRLLNLKSNFKKYILASIVGTLYATVAIIANNFFVSHFFKVVVGIIMIIIAYPIISIRNIFNIGTLFILSVGFIGGIIVAMNIESNFINQLIGFIISSLLLLLFYKVNRNMNIFEKLKCKIKIQLEGNIFEVNAFIDTGNTLKDSVSGESVIFVFEDRLKQELTEELMRILKSEVFDFDEKYFGKIKMLSCKGVDNKNEIIVGIKAESVIVENEEYIIKNENIIIAAGKTNFNGCEALIGLNVLEEGYVYGNSTSFKNESKKVME